MLPRIVQDLLELGARCLYHAIGDVIFAWGFVGLQYVTFVTFFGDKKCDASHSSHFWEECDALAHENIFFNL